MIMWKPLKGKSIFGTFLVKDEMGFTKINHVGGRLYDLNTFSLFSRIYRKASMTGYEVDYVMMDDGSMMEVGKAQSLERDVQDLP